MPGPHLLPCANWDIRWSCSVSDPRLGWRNLPDLPRVPAAPPPVIGDDSGERKYLYAITYVIDMDGAQGIAPQFGQAVPPAGRGIYLSKSNFIAALLRELIISGELKPGAQLRQRDLAERFGVSVTPVREAPRWLESEGLVT